MEINEMKSLYKTKDDFIECVDKGVELLKAGGSPDREDLESMRQLLSIYITATINLNPKAADEDTFKAQVASGKMLLFAAYTLGRKAEQRENGHPNS